MLIERIKYYLAKLKYLTYLLFALVIIVCVYVFAPVAFPIIIGFDASHPNLFSAFFGAILGGFFTLTGSVYVMNREQKYKASIKKKEQIYEPLYKEIKYIHTVILMKNPYPSYIQFIESKQTMKPHPQYITWDKIKNDSRFLETPPKLVKYMNFLYAAIDIYFKCRAAINEPILVQVDKILAQEIGTSCHLGNLGDIIVGMIFSDRIEDIYNKYLTLSNKEIKISDDKVLSINEKIRNECRNIPEVKKLHAVYNAWLKKQEDVLKYLGILIKTVNFHYST